MSTTIQRFEDLCWANARLWQIGERTLPQCVDRLYGWAFQEGLVRHLGTDAVQKIMAAAFLEVYDAL